MAMSVLVLSENLAVATREITLIYDFFLNLFNSNECTILPCHMCGIKLERTYLIKKSKMWTSNCLITY